MDEKKRIKNFMRKTLISIGVLSALFVGMGIIYTWYMGQNVDTATVEASIEFEPEKLLKPVEQSETVPQSASVQSLTSPVLPGSNVAITVRTNQKSTCSISFIYNEIASKDSGLVDKPSDEYGMVSWSFTVGNSVPLGKWPVKVTCARNEKSAVVIGDLVVVAKLEP